MSDHNDVRRVSWYRIDGTGYFDDDPNGTHYLVPAEMFERVKYFDHAEPGIKSKYLTRYEEELSDENERLREVVAKSYRELMEAGMGHTTTARRLEDALDGESLQSTAADGGKR